MDAKKLSEELRDQATTLYKAAPQVMQAFQSVMLAANKNGVLPAKIKELMAVAISISVKCEGCIVFHVQSAIKHGATREELVEAIAVSVEMGGGPATVYAGKALAAFDELKS
ncbi:AhpD family alkylhydroperoxidase [Bradyrhizobium sp. USDA 4461]